MFTRRKLLRTLPPAAAAGLLGSCEQADPPPRYVLPEQPISVVTTTALAADLIRQAGREAVQVSSLIPPAVNPHLWQPTAADRSAIQVAQVFVMHGMGLEEKFTDDVENLRKSGLFVCVLSDCLTEADKIAGDDGKPDPHFWMNPELWCRAAGYAAEVLGQASPPAAAFFGDSAHEYVTNINVMHRNLLARFGAVPTRDRYLASSHDTLRYLAAVYGVEARSVQTASGEALPEAQANSLKPWLKENGVSSMFRESGADLNVLIPRMNSYGLAVSKVIISLSLGPPHSLMPGLSEELDTSTYAGALRYTCETIYSELMLH